MAEKEGKKIEKTPKAKSLRTVKSFIEKFHLNIQIF